MVRNCQGVGVDDVFLLTFVAADDCTLLPR